MNIQPIKTPRISPNSHELLDLIDQVVPDMPEKSVLIITSKIVSLCEGNVVPVGSIDKQELVRREADFIAGKTSSQWNIQFTIKDNTLIPNAGIDESNAEDVYVLWPKDAQATANRVREHLTERFGRGQIGVIITDSTCRPLRRGVSGIALAFSGIKPLRDYVGSPDLFGRPFKVAQADIVGGLAGTGVLMMGEGTESTPLVLMQNASIADFVDRNPSSEELASVRIDLAEDLFESFLTAVDWQPGGGNKS